MKTVASICMVLKVMAIMPTWMQTGVVSVPVAKLACEVNSIDTNFWYECSRQMEEPCVQGRHLKIPEANCSAGTVDKNQLCVSCPEGTYLDFRNHCDECLKWTECGPGMMENPALLPNILRDRDCIPITAFTRAPSLSARPEISDNISTSTADASTEMNMSHPMGNSSLPAPQPMDDDDDDDIGYKAAIGGLAGLVLVLIVILVVIAVKCHLGRKSVEWKRDCDQQQEQPQEPQIHRNARGASADNRDDADGNQEEEARHLLAEDPPPSSSSRGDGQANSAEASHATVMVHLPPASVNSPPTSGPVNCGSQDAASNDILADSYLSWLAEQITPKEKVALSTQLGFNDAQLKCVETEYQGDTRRQNYEMLLNWRKRAEGDGLSKVRQLGQALANEQVGRTDLRDELFSRYGLQATSSQRRVSQDHSGKPDEENEEREERCSFLADNSSTSSSREDGPANSEGHNRTSGDVIAPLVSVIVHTNGPVIEMKQGKRLQHAQGPNKPQGRNDVRSQTDETEM